ncbi:hypothetical protein GWK47_006581 [Chionoecetes opilio]|uniref:Uncharacterized protein n=1 Tax=Chionoecetes opilio TaxID=41210 RepID=A0A8J5CUB4_CHIOP|nr:hypothetical protein GWK47_006581 [Chionoecetes opilio]
MEMAASFAVVISCSRPRATCPYTAVADTGAQVSGGGSPTVGGPRHIPTSAPGYTHGSPHVAGGSMRLLGTITCQVSVGTVPQTTECIYIAEGRGSNSTYRSRHARALRLVHHTFLRAPFHPPVCVLWSHQTPQKTHVVRKRHLTNL